MSIIKKIKWFLPVIMMLIVMIGCRVSAINSGWFNNNYIPEEYKPIPTDDKISFIILKTGQNIPVNEIKYSTQQNGKKPFVLTADGKVYTAESVASFQVDRLNYFVGFGNKFYRRLVDGKISVYGLDKYISRKDRNGFWQPNWETYYSYSKAGSNLKDLFNMKEMSNAVEDCPLAQSMIKGSYLSVYNKVMKSNGRLIYKVFSVYNNGCK